MLRRILKSQNMVAKLSLVIILICLLVMVIFSLTGHYIIEWLYGKQYASVNNILIFTVFVTLFSGLSTLRRSIC